MSEPKRLGPARRVAGDLVVPGDKSVSHRAVLFGALAEGTSRVRGALDGDDNRRTLAATAAMGARHRRDGDALVIEGVGLGGLRAPEGPLDMGNSGTTTRLLLGVLAGQSFEATLFGDPSLSRRPMRRVTEPLRQMGADIRGAEDANFLPLEVRGGSLHGIRYDLPVASAQVHGALVLAGLRAEGETIVTLPGPARDHTDRMLRAMGAAIETDAGLRRTVVRRTERLRPLDFDVPGDLSSAAFFLVAALLVPDSEVVLRGVGVNPTRTGLLGVLRTMGARIEEVNLAVRSGEPVADLIVRMEPLMGVDVGGEVIPRLIDEIPILAVAATQAEGTTTIRDAGELRVKESDRI
ncbi:MAG: 3-phosphoshikimate 1-carboxyvinyltransferase, partial [Myxococcales bacterium]|nr:3-phosphoshikimate 1-carboxyvinyltransferase [Myxococcales bacterium]